MNAQGDFSILAQMQHDHARGWADLIASGANTAVSLYYAVKGLPDSNQLPGVPPLPAAGTGTVSGPGGTATPVLLATGGGAPPPPAPVDVVGIRAQIVEQLIRKDSTDRRAERFFPFFIKLLHTLVVRAFSPSPLQQYLTSQCACQQPVEQQQKCEMRTVTLQVPVCGPAGGLPW